MRDRSNQNSNVTTGGRSQIEEHGRERTEEERIAVPRLMTAKDIGEMLGISARMVNKLARVGRLGCVQLTPRKRLFTKELVEEFIQAVTFHRHPICDAFLSDYDAKRQW